MAYWETGKSWRDFLLPFGDLSRGRGTQLDVLDITTHVGIQIVAAKDRVFGELSQWL